VDLATRPAPVALVVVVVVVAMKDIFFLSFFCRFCAIARAIYIYKSERERVESSFQFCFEEREEEPKKKKENKKKKKSSERVSEELTRQTREIFEISGHFFGYLSLLSRSFATDTHY